MKKEHIHGRASPPTSPQTRFSPPKENVPGWDFHSAVLARSGALSGACRGFKLPFYHTSARLLMSSLPLDFCFPEAGFTRFLRAEPEPDALQRLTRWNSPPPRILTFYKEKAIMNHLKAEYFGVFQRQWMDLEIIQLNRSNPDGAMALPGTCAFPARKPTSHALSLITWGELVPTLLQTTAAPARPYLER